MTDSGRSRRLCGIQLRVALTLLIWLMASPASAQQQPYVADQSNSRARVGAALMIYDRQCGGLKPHLLKILRQLQDSGEVSPSNVSYVAAYQYVLGLAWPDMPSWCRGLAREYRMELDEFPHSTPKKEP